MKNLFSLLTAAPFGASALTIARLLVVSISLQIACSHRLCAAEAAPDPTGHWEGAIALPPAPLSLNVDLAQGMDRAWQGTIDIAAQGLRGFKLDPVKVDGLTISFGLPGIPGGPLFKGRLSDDGKNISGEFLQGGQSLPFKLSRVAKPVVAPVVAVPGKGVAGRWQGSLKPRTGVELRLALEFAKTSAEKTEGVLVSLDQGNARIPVTTFSVNENAVHFEAASVGGIFDGKLNGDGSELAGEWAQKGPAMPLVFRRLPSATTPPSDGESKTPGPRVEATLPRQFKWLVVSPIPILPAGTAAQPDESAQKKAFTTDLLAASGGEAQARPKLGDKLTVNGVEREWEAAQPVDGAISLNSSEHQDDFELAYASTDFDVPTETKAWLGIGSDDGVRVWLNGALIHENWSARPVQVDEDVVSVTLNPGTNHLLIKVQNITGSWGFACRLMDAEARAERLVAAVRNGDLAAAKTLVGKGFDLNGRTSGGLTPYLAARMGGQSAAASYLEKSGADTRVTPPAPEPLVDALLAKRISKDGAGAAVLVARNGTILYEKAYGLADIEHHSPVTVDTRFRIGSITKQFTASGILRLQEAGKLKVTDVLSKFYPDYPRGGEVTLQRLLTHTSGIHSYTEGAGFLQGVTKPTTGAELVASIKQFPFDFNPGEKWSYCNSGYFLLGNIIEQVSGRDYGVFLQETFFVPLGMTNTGVYHNDRPPSQAAVGYEYENGRFKKALDWDMTWAGGAGALYSTVKDLYRWNEAVFVGHLLEKDDLAAAFTPVTTEENKNDKSDGGYGYGWAIGRFRGVREISHNGGLNGFLSNLLRLPDQNLTVVVLVNEFPPKPGTEPGTLSHEIAEFYLGSELAPKPTPASFATKALSREALAEVVGRYDYGGLILDVTQEGDKVYAQLGPQARFEIFSKSETEFFWKVVDAQVTFVKAASGKAVAAIHHQGGMTTHAPRLAEVTEVKLDDAQTDPLLGDYDFEPTGKMTISREGGVMYGQLTGQPKLKLGTISATELFVWQVNAQVTFVKDAEGKVEKAILHQRGQNYDLPKIAGGITQQGAK